MEVFLLAMYAYILAGAVDMVLPSYIDLTKTFPTYMLLRAHDFFRDEFI
jgi:hypothetical protein